MLAEPGVGELGINPRAYLHGGAGPPIALAEGYRFTLLGINKWGEYECCSMAAEQEALRDWHRLFGLLLTDFFSGSPFVVDVERDLSVQQQFLDVTIVRRGRGRFVGRLPDGLEGLRPHNLMSFKSHHETLDDWAMKELVGADVAYRKLVSPSPSDLLPAEQFGLYAVAARSPHQLAQQVPWQKVQDGVYDCRWGTDTVRVLVAGELPREPHNAPLHLFSAQPELLDFGRNAYQRRSANTSALLGQLFGQLRAEGFTVSYTMPPERRLAGMPPEERLAGLSAEQIRQYLERLTARRPTAPRKPRRKK